jgi:hypothetical protein
MRPLIDDETHSKRKGSIKNDSSNHWVEKQSNHLAAWPPLTGDNVPFVERNCYILPALARTYNQPHPEMGNKPRLGDD